MEEVKKIEVKYRLFKVHNEQHKDEHHLIFKDVTEDNYGKLYASSKDFDSSEEAISFALISNEWMWCDFTVIPLYRIKVVFN